MRSPATRSLSICSPRRPWAVYQRQLAPGGRSGVSCLEPVSGPAAGDCGARRRLGHGSPRCRHAATGSSRRISSDVGAGDRTTLLSWRNRRWRPSRKRCTHGPICGVDRRLFQSACRFFSGGCQTRNSVTRDNLRGITSLPAEPLTQKMFKTSHFCSFRSFLWL